MKIINDNKTLRSFRFTIGLIEGYEQGRQHTLAEVQKILGDWFATQKAKNEPYFHGVTYEAAVSYLKRNDDSLVTEPVVIFEGNINSMHYGSLADEEVIKILMSLAELIMQTLNQTRLYFSYNNQLYIAENQK